MTPLIIEARVTSYADSIYLCQWDDIFRTFDHIQRNQPTLIQLNSKERVHKFWKEGVKIEIRIGTSLIYFNVTFCINLFTKKLTFCVWINHWKTKPISGATQHISPPTHLNPAWSWSWTIFYQILPNKKK